MRHAMHATYTWRYAYNYIYAAQSYECKVDSILFLAVHPGRSSLLIYSATECSEPAVGACAPGSQRDV